MPASSDDSTGKSIILALLGLFILVQGVGLYLGSKLVAIPEIVPATEAKASGIEAAEVDSLLAMLKKNGDVYSPKHGQFKTAEDR